MKKKPGAVAGLAARFDAEFERSRGLLSVGDFDPRAQCAFDLASVIERRPSGG
jgi:hypothetical protein